MKIIQKKIFIYILIILVLLFLILQSYYLKNNFIKNKYLHAKIKKQQQNNMEFKTKYQKNIKKKNSNNNRHAKPLAAKTASILAKVKTLNLKLIDLNRTKNEINLNISGDFHSILNLIKYLEIEMIDLKIREFKLKDNNQNLFLFLKLTRWVDVK
ncbi:hypothetical protein [Halanaerobium praevalens]|uniref:Uncharacterized protein n=1 Tax=Halanaerobium praevalens (strain ATCC 33744 / DSM 2228 / GSL) TaxID=572479 RepID=E3DRJ0_HALPG|nr:hypothetical protein [Halanaerobium praevalens]ADO77031.1 hypothetical protein Hprae_0877 [Halanaerobium praevalens DSM 2228]